MAVSDDILELTPTQLDALREIGNVGAGNSATALSQIINHRIDMNVPEVSIVPLTEVPDLVGGPDVMVAGVFLRVYGAAPSNILFLLPQESAFYLVDMILGKQRGDTKTLDFMDESALMEIGNILILQFHNQFILILCLQYCINLHWEQTLELHCIFLHNVPSLSLSI